MKSLYLVAAFAAALALPTVAAAQMQPIPNPPEKPHHMMKHGHHHMMKGHHHMMKHHMKHHHHHMKKHHKKDKGGY